MPYTMGSRRTGYRMARTMMDIVMTVSVTAHGLLPAVTGQEPYGRAQNANHRDNRESICRGILLYQGDRVVETQVLKRHLV